MSDKDKPDVEITHSEVYIKQKPKPGFLKFIKSAQGFTGRINHGDTAIDIKSETLHLTPEQAKSLPEKELLEEIEWYEGYAAQQRPQKEIEKKAVQNLQAACSFVRAGWRSADKNPFQFALSVLELSQAARTVEKLATEQALATGKRMRKETPGKQEAKNNACLEIKKLLAAYPEKSPLWACQIVAGDATLPQDCDILVDYIYPGSYRTLERECKKRDIRGAKPKKGRPIGE